MTVWFVAAGALLLGTIPCGVVMMRDGILDALVALQMAGVLTTLALLLIAQGIGRSPFFDLPLVAAFLSFAGGLAFARFLERWT